MEINIITSPHVLFYITINQREDITCSKTLQLRSQLDALHVKLKILMANCCKLGADCPNIRHHSAAKS